MKLRKLIVGAFLLLPITLFAQKGSKENIAYYLDDEGISTQRNFLKLNLTSIYQGEISVSLERLFGKQFSLEFGAGLLLPFYNEEFTNEIIDNGENSFDDPNTGFSLLFSPRYYIKNMDESYYCSIPLRFRYYPGQIALFDTSINIGKQWVWNNGFLLDISGGVGLGIQDSLDDKSYIFHAEERSSFLYLIEEYPTTMRLIFPIAVKVGYRF